MGLGQEHDSPAGQKPQWFATTHWSVVLTAKNGDAAQAAGALERLCQTYWPPLYAYIRREGHGVADAQDLTQEFFSALLQKDYLQYLQDRRGKFRSFLLTLLKHFLADQRDKAATQKRGGGKTFVSLDDTSVDDRYFAEPSGVGPDQVFERQWAQTILEQAVKRLREEYLAQGQGALFDRMKDFQPGKHGTFSYVEVGAQLGMTESAVKSAVHRLRLRHREILREEIAHTVADSEEIDEEIRYLLTLVSGN
jgi:RNA polymerase sigma-70 factor (ECF subfamily)